MTVLLCLQYIIYIVKSVYSPTTFRQSVLFTFFYQVLINFNLILVKQKYYIFVICILVLHMQIEHIKWYIFCILIKENISGYLHIYFDKNILYIFRNPLVSRTVFISLEQLQGVSSFVSLKGICNRVHILTIDPEIWQEYWNKCTEPSQKHPTSKFTRAIF